MTTDMVDKLQAEVCNSGIDWSRVTNLTPEEAFVVSQSLAHGPLSHNGSTRMCLEGALRKARLA